MNLWITQYPYMQNIVATVCHILFKMMTLLLAGTVPTSASSWWQERAYLLAGSLARVLPGPV